MGERQASMMLEKFIVAFQKIEFFCRPQGTVSIK